jgi:hypothetical protein
VTTKKRKSPPERQRHSLERGRRNTDGKNDKASCKNNPRLRNISHRSTGYIAKRQTRMIDQQPDVGANLLEPTLTRSRLNRGRWRNSAYQPLGKLSTP